MMADRYKPAKMQATAASLFFAVLILAGCNSDKDPVRENTPELITKAVLTFTSVGGGATEVAMAVDPDGEGVHNIEVNGPIDLSTSTTYTLTVQLMNELVSSSDPDYDLTAQVLEEGAEHMFFFGWTNEVFASPGGNGNVDSRADAVSYLDEDSNGQPIGLTTTWTTSATPGSGTFRILLKHQPGLKSSTSSSSDGESDLDITFDINVD